MSMTWQELVEQVRTRCAATGTDIVQPFQVACYNQAVDEANRLPSFERASTLGLLVGSSRALWPHFLAAIRAEPERLEDENPFDTFAGEEILRALRPVPVRFESRWYYELPPRRVAMQRLAHISGLAYLSRSHLNVHPTFGPWIGFSAAIVFDLDGPPPPWPEPANPCSACDVNCDPVFQRAVDAAKGQQLVRQIIIDNWRVWVAVRDACPVGREYRYSDDQIEYHYTKDRQVLRRLIGK